MIFRLSHIDLLVESPARRVMNPLEKFLPLFFQKEGAVKGAQPLKSAFLFCKAFFFAPLVPKKKASLFQDITKNL